MTCQIGDFSDGGFCDTPREATVPLTLPRELIQVEVESGPLGEDQRMKRKRFSEEQILALATARHADVAVAVRR